MRQGGCCQLCHQPDDISVLLTAPTGIAAYSLNAATIHHTLSIGTHASLPYIPLGEDKLNSESLIEAPPNSSH